MQQCRYYQRKLPQEGEVVLVKVASIEQNSLIRVSLIEYAGLQSMLPFASTGLKCGRNDTIQSVLATLGKNFAVKVMKIDPQSGFLDLDKRQVSDEEAAEAQARYTRNTNVFTFAMSLHKKFESELTLEQTYETYVWEFDDPFAAFTEFTEDPALMDKYLEGKPHPDDVREQIMKRFKQSPCTIYVDVKLMSCYSVLGVEVIKDAIKAAKKVSEQWTLGPEEKPLEITVVAPPIYRATLVTKNKKEGKAHMQQFYDELKKQMEKHNGKCSTDQGVQEEKSKKE